jgi:hypothetical protein
MPRQRVYAAVVVFVTLVALALVNVWYVRRVDRDSSREICGLIVVLDDAYQETKPTTPLGQHIADEVHRYRQRLGC